MKNETNLLDSAPLPKLNLARGAAFMAGLGMIVANFGADKPLPSKADNNGYDILKELQGYVESEANLYAERGEFFADEKEREAIPFNRSLADRLLEADALDVDVCDGFTI
jgi:hypothetical protein